MYPRILTTVAGLVVGLIAAQSLGMFGGGAPTILSPVPFLLIIPGFLGVPLPLIVLAFVGIFWLWCSQLFSGETSIPKRTTVLLIVTAVLSTAGFAVDWKAGIAYQGLTHTAACIIASTSLLACCAFMFWRVRKRPTLGGSLLLHTLTFAWIASYALPYLGETP